MAIEPKSFFSKPDSPISYTASSMILSATVLLVAQRWLPIVQVNSTRFSSNKGTNGGAMAMQSVTNATLTGITAVGNNAAYGGGMLIDRAALIQVLSLRWSMHQHPQTCVRNGQDKLL